MAETIQPRLGDSGDQSLPALRRRRPPPASLAQRAMWEVAKHDPGRLTNAGAYRIRGRLDVETLRLAIEQIAVRHEILRTTFDEAADNGRLVQLIHPPRRLDLPLHDLRFDPEPERRAAELLMAETSRPLDPRTGPLVRFGLLRIGELEHHLLRTYHHLIADALSWKVFLDELAVHYEALTAGAPSPLPDEPALQYADYATWERDWVRQAGRRRPQRYTAEIEWWQHNLGSAPPTLKLPFARSERLEPPGSPDCLLEWGLSPECSQALDLIGRDVTATYYMIRLALFAAALALQTQTDDLVVATQVSARTQRDLLTMIGLLVRPALVRLRGPQQLGFRSWVAVVREAVIDVSAHCTIPNLALWRELGDRGVSRPAPAAGFDLIYQAAPARFGGLEVEPLPRAPTAPTRFMVRVARSYESDRCRAEFDPRIHDPNGVARFIAGLQNLAGAVCAQPDTPLGALHQLS